MLFQVMSCNLRTDGDVERLGGSTLITITTGGKEHVTIDHGHAHIV